MKIKIKNARLSFPDIFVARPFKAGDPPRYKATLLIPKDDPQVNAIEKAILAAAKEKFGDKAESVLKAIRNNPNKFNFQDGDNKEYDGYGGMMAFSASSASRPLIIDRVGVTRDEDKDPNASYTQPNAQGIMFRILAMEDGRPYAGCFVNATVDVFAYREGGNGISASLKGLQFVKDGDAFGGGAPASLDDFDDLGVDEETDDDLMG